MSSLSQNHEELLLISILLGNINDELPNCSIVTEISMLVVQIDGKITLPTQQVK